MTTERETTTHHIGSDIDAVRRDRAETFRAHLARYKAHVAAGEMPKPGPRLNPIEKAKLAPKSLTKALRAYWWDMEGVIANQGTPEAVPQRQAAEARYRESRDLSRQIGLPAVIKGICWVCVSGDDDPGGGERVKNCRCASCPLHPVRPKKVGQTPKHLIAELPDRSEGGKEKS